MSILTTCLGIDESVLKESSIYDVEQHISSEYWRDRYLWLLEKYNIMLQKACSGENS